MPEGDTIFRAAARLRRVLLGKMILGADIAVPEFRSANVVGLWVSQIEAKGKHLLITLGENLVVHTHLGMTGSWHLYRSGEPWKKPAARARVQLEVPNVVAICFSPKTVELLSPAGVRGHRHLNRLGPDLLVTPLDEQEVLRRFRFGNSLAIGEAIMNQTIICGVGNVYKSEVLFLEQVNPFVRVQDLADAVLLGVVRRASELMGKNLDRPERTTRFALDGRRLWVYGRSGQLCLKCGAILQMRRQGDLGRSTYWCEVCQGKPLLTSR